MPTVLENTKKAVEVIEKYGFQSVIAVDVSAPAKSVTIQIYEPAELQGFECQTIPRDERGCSDFDEIFVELDGVKVLSLINDEKLLTA